jgi:hypothetical protein
MVVEYSLPLSGFDLPPYNAGLAFCPLLVVTYQTFETCSADLIINQPVVGWILSAENGKRQGCISTDKEHLLHLDLGSHSPVGPYSAHRRWSRTTFARTLGF